MKHHARLLAFATLLVSACSADQPPDHNAVPQHVIGDVITIATRSMPGLLDAAGIAKPIAEATLSTKLMASVREIRVREGDMVRAGQILAVLDASDLDARGQQVSASIAEAEAMQREAETQARRMRALYAEEAAPKAQLDAAETGLARATARVATARAGKAELSAMRDYSIIRAPFAGTITRRFVDEGSFAAPGVALLTIQDARRLRVSATAAPQAVRSLRRGDSVTVKIEGLPTRAVFEGAVPASAAVYTVNVIVDNSRLQFLAGSAASIELPFGTHDALLIPSAALRREGDLTGVLVRMPQGTELRWIRTGRIQGDQVEVVSGLRPGEQIVVPVGAGAR